MTSGRGWALVACGALFVSGCSSVDTDGRSTITDPDAASSSSTTVPGGATDARSVVFEGGEDGIDTFRIPAVIESDRGTVVAFAEARTLSPHDLDPRHIVVRRSVDQGSTWGPIAAISRPEDPACSQNDPVPVGSQSGDLILVFRNCDVLSTSTSTDDGESWSEPRPVALGDGADPQDLEGFRPGPGHGIRLRGAPQAGRVVIPIDRNVGDASELALLLSDDGGVTWRFGARLTTTSGDPDIDETAVAETDDGTILVSSRNGSTVRPGRVELLSPDGGESFADWSTGGSLRIATDLTGPVVEGALIGSDDGPLVVYSSPSDPQYRRGLRLWFRTGEGAWTAGPLAVPGPAAYSDLTFLDGLPGGIGLLVETGDRHPYQRIDFIRMGPEQLDRPGDALSEDYDVAGAVAGRVVVDGKSFEIVSYCLGAPRIELDGGWIEPDLSGGFGSVGFRAHLDDRGDGTPLELEGIAALDITSGIRFRGPLPDLAGAPHQVDLAMVNMEPCP